jgi:spoIIIJ-associated protein
MLKAKDFYGKDIAEVIEQACKDIGASREELDIEVLETGSAGIFGLCKKKAHIRVQRKAAAVTEEAETAPPIEQSSLSADYSLVTGADQADQVASAPEAQIASSIDSDPTVGEQVLDRGEAEDEDLDNEGEDLEEEPPVVPPSAENIAAIQHDLHRLLTLMGLPSEVQVCYEAHTVQCNITGPYEAHIVGTEGRTLDSLQYLLRKMVARHLPDRIMLALNAGDFRERRAEELKKRARELAELVKEDGKTQAIPALNPSERRVVHMVLQEDKGVRSRSVGEGLFKKVLIYKPGKGRRPVSKKRRGGQGGRPSGD